MLNKLKKILQWFVSVCFILSAILVPSALAQTESQFYD